LQSDRPRRRLLQQVAAVTAPLLAVVVLRVPHLGLAFRLWVVAVGAIGIASLTEWALAGRAVQDVKDARLRRAWWRRPGSDRVRPLEELEHAVDFSLGTAFDVHFRLRPHLRRVAAHRLAARGVSLDQQPERARALLGQEAWELVRSDRPEPEDRAARGLELARLRRVVEALGAI
jgi:hypothetical protein